MADLRSRARKSGPSCEALVDKWDGYEDDAELAAITEPWSEDDMRTTIDVETEYRALCEAVSVRDVGQGLVEHRCLTEDAELRADMDKREVTGTLVRYGDEARLPGFRERIAKGAFTLPKSRVQRDAAARPRSADRACRLHRRRRRHALSGSRWPRRRVVIRRWPTSGPACCAARPSRCAP